MDSIKDILPDVIKSITADNVQEKGDIELSWQNASGAFAQHTKIIGWQKGILTIAVADNTRLYELKMQKQHLLKKVQSDIEDVKDIVLKIGKVL